MKQELANNFRTVSRFPPLFYTSEVKSEQAM